jgi:leukocyte elastase inhibitor
MPLARCRAVPIVTATMLLAALTPQGAAAQEGIREVPLAFTRQYRGEVTAALTRAYNASGQVLFRDFSAAPGNIVFSPYSIGTAMAMVLAGARGETEREMAAVLQHSLARAPINDANASAIAILNGYDKSEVPPICPPAMRLAGERCEAEPNPDSGCPFPAGRVGEICVATPRFAPSAKLLVANALMLAGGEVAKDYSALLKDRYAAEVFQRASLETVNGWVRQRTEGKIEKIIDKLSDVILINAVYFKSRWAVVFDKKLTKPEFFSLTRSRQEMVPTMLQRTNHAVVSREGYRAIRLPYAVRSLAMVIALPNEVEGLGDVARRLDQDELTQMLAALRKEPPRPVSLMLPSFKTEYAADLKGVFQKAGMTLPFDGRRSDFSGLTGVSPQLAPTTIDQIVHKAVIEVSEESTEAAATTAIGIRITSAAPPVEPLQFRVDRPFLYYLVDDATGAVLFQGRVVDPR